MPATSRAGMPAETTRPSDRSLPADGAGDVRPIIFSGPMVRALLEGRKTQTRRIAKRPTDHFRGSCTHLHQDGDRFVWSDGKGGCQHVAKVPGAFGDRLWVRETWQTGSGYAGPQVAYRATGDAHDIDAWDGEDEGAGPSFNYDRLPGLTWHTWLPDLLSGTEGAWRSPIHMPRALSRLTLIVESIRVERLAEISREDAIAEGASSRPRCYGYNDHHDGWSLDWSQVGKPSRFASNGATLAERDISLFSPQTAFGSFINDLHDPRWNHKGDGIFGTNPWVAVIGFRVVRANIDTLDPDAPANAGGRT